MRGIIQNGCNRSISSRLPTFPASAADQDHVASTPGTTWPVGRVSARLIPGREVTPGFDAVSILSDASTTSPLRGFALRPPDPYLTPLGRPFHIAHHGRVTASAACGGLKPPPAGQLRRAYLHHSHSIAFSRSTTHCGLPRSWRTSSQDFPTTPPRTLQRCRARMSAGR